MSRIEYPKGYRRPRPLTHGDKVAVLSPASAIDPSLVDLAAGGLRALGYEPVIMPHTKGRVGSYSGTVGERLDDIRSALIDDDVRAIVCSRGGYGCVHLLEALEPLPEHCFDKWLVGFSDISALHALWINKGYASVHGSMAKMLARSPEDPHVLQLNALLGGGEMNVSWESETKAALDVTGILRGGNLAVLQALIGTPYDDLVAEGSILFIEDIAEPIYKVDRIISQLKLSGRLEKYKAVIVGQFTEYRPDSNHAGMYEMLRERLDGCKVPVVYDAPVGHVENNTALLHGAMVKLTARAGRVQLISFDGC